MSTTAERSSGPRSTPEPRPRGALPRSVLLGATLVLLTAPSLRPAEEAGFWKEDLCTVLRDLPKTAQEHKKFDLLTLEAEADASDPKLATPGTLLLMAKDHPVEVYWWRKQARVSRAFVAALLLASEPKEGAPGASTVSVDSRRFRPEEAEARLEEVTFVKDHLSAIASLLAAALKSLGLQHQKAYEAFAETAREAGGEPLACAPDSR
jgi:hypothetical protein